TACKSSRTENTPARNRAGRSGGQGKRSKENRFHAIRSTPVAASLWEAQCGWSFQKPTSPAGRRLQLRPVDYDDLSGILPVVCVSDQSRANWILPDVIPFLRVAFIAAQKMIEKPPLPDWRFRSWMLDLLCEVLFQHADPASQLEVIGSTNE